jgi:hypothetical protein
VTRAVFRSSRQAFVVSIITATKRDPIEEVG